MSFYAEIQIAEPLVYQPGAFEVQTATDKLTTYKPPGSNRILT